jgi:flagellar motor switch protein FliM
MNQVLSQSEVDALLAAVSEGELAADGGEKPAGGDERVVVVYDLTSQDRIIRGRLPQLDVIYEKFMRSFRVSLSSALRKIAALNHASTDFLKFGEFINTLPMPTCMSVLRFNALRGSALLVIESKLAYALVDSFFGGDDRPYTKIEGKDFTPIELSIVKKVVELAIEDLEQAWISVESDQTDKTLWANIIQEQLVETDVDIKVDLGYTEITLQELMDLKLGDVISLDQDANGEFDVQVEGAKKFKGFYGINHGSVAVQVTKKIVKE